MAKIPANVLKNIITITNQMESQVETIKRLTQVVNDDTVSWHNLEIPITESIRQQVIDEYNDAKAEIESLVQSLP